MSVRTLPFCLLACLLCAPALALSNVSVAQFGATPDGILRTDGAIVAGSTLLTSPSGTFSSADAGKYIQILGAGSGGTAHSDGAVSAGSAILSSASASFAQTDVGRSIVVIGAGVAGQNLTTRIAGFNSSGSITLASPAVSGVTGATYFYGAMTLEATIQRVQSPTVAVLTSPAQATTGNAMYAYGTNFSAAFQSAVDAAGQAGGGTVSVPGPATCPGGAVCGYVISATDQMTAYAPGAVKIRYNNVSLVGGSQQTNLFCRGAWGLYTNSPAFPGQTATIRGNCLSIGDNGGPQGAAGTAVSNVTISGLHLYGMTDGNTYNNSFEPTSPPLTTTGDGWDETHKAILMWWNSAFSGITINSVYIQDFKGENIYSGGSVVTGMVIENSTMTNFNGDAISLLAADLQVLNNTMSNGSNAGVENASTSSTNTALVRQLFQGNTMSNFPREGLVVVGVDAGVAAGAVQIVNNTFSTIGQVNPSAGQVAILIGAQYGGGNLPPANVTISGNSCHDCYSFVQLQTSGNTGVTGNNIVVDQYSSGDLFIVPFPMSNVTIAGNTGSLTPAAAAGGRGPSSVYSLDWGSPSLPWTNVSIHDNSWAFPGHPNYFFLTTANGGWNVVNQQNIVWQNDLCAGCTYPDVNHGLVYVGSTPLIPPFGPEVAVTEAGSPVNVSIDAGREQNGSQLTVLNSGQQPVTFSPDNNISISGPLTLQPGNSVQFTYSGAVGKFVTATLPLTVPVTVQTSSIGLGFTVDGVSYTTSQTFQWTPNSSHTLATTATQAGSAGTQFVFASWSDGGALSHTVAPGASTTYTASFNTQYLLTTSVIPAQGGTITAGGWFNAGTGVSVQAAALAGYQFTGFSGNLMGSANPQTIVMNAPQGVTANFTAIGPASYSLSAAPASLSVLQGFSGAGLIYITPSNGFSGAVTLSASGLPQGVTASFTASFNTANIVTFAVAPTAAAATSTVTITGVSGSLSHTTTLSLSVLTPASGNVPFNLSSAYNVSGIAADGVPFSGGGLDEGGYAYSGILLGASQIVSGVPFGIGPMNGPDAVSAITVPLPAAQFATLKILAAGVNGSQTSQNFTVQYTDGTQSTFTQSLSDWFFPQNYTGETTALATPYRDTGIGTEDARTFQLYEYSFSLAAGKTVSSIGLPNNRDVVVVAITGQPPVPVPVTVQTSPGGLSFTVDGISYATPQTFQWIPGTSHTLATTATQAGSTGAQSVFGSWSDGGALSHSVAPPSAATYTASFNTQYLLTTSATPAQGGTIAAGGWYNAGSSVSVQAAALPGYQFSGFSGNLSGTTNPQTIVMNGPETVTAAFTAVSVGNYSLSAAPASLSVLQGFSGASLVQITPSNGFNGSVTLTASGLPAGVTASFGAADIVTFAVAPAAAAGTSIVTVTGVSGSLSRTTTLSLTVLAPATGYVPFSLSAAYNVSGVAADGVPFSGGGLDAAGSSYSGMLLGASQTVGGVPFGVGQMNVPDAVSSTTVPLPSGQFGTLKILATAVDGNQNSQNFTVNYTDGTQSNFTQSLSDWYTPQSYSGETIGVTTAYRDTGTGGTQALPFILYEYSFSLLSGKTVSSIVLPNNRSVVVLAITGLGTGGVSGSVAPAPVNLTPAYNITGIATDGVPLPGGGLDGVGNSYSGTLLGTSQTIAGIPFTIGPAASLSQSAADAVSSATVALPSGQFGTVKILATGVDGNQNLQNFTVTYTDGTQSAYSQSLSDWYTPQDYTGETIALVMPHRDMSSGALDGRSFQLYEYSFSLTAGRTAASIALPNNRNVVVLAITMSQ